MASGTPHDLKARFGEGYNLTLVVTASVTASGGPDATTVSQPASQRAAELAGYVSSHVPGAQLLPGHAASQPAGLSQPGPASQQGSFELTFRLPRSEAGQFPGLLCALDAAVTHSKAVSGVEAAVTGQGGAVGAPQCDPELLGVTSYGLSVTTLEEVFLAVTEAVAEGKEPGQLKDADVNNAGAEDTGQAEAAAVTAKHGHVEEGSGYDEEEARAALWRGRLSGWSLVKQQVRWRGKSVGSDWHTLQVTRLN